DLHDGTRPDYGKHGSVGKTYKAINATAEVHMLDQANRNLSPNLAQFREKIRAIQLEFLLRLHRHHDRVVSIRHPRGQLRLRGREHRLIAAEVAEIAAESRKDAGPVNVVDCAQAVLLAGARSVGAVLDVVQPAPRNEIVRVLFLLSKLPAAFFHLPQAQPEAVSYPLQANAYPFGLRACFHEPGSIIATSLLYISERVHKLAQPLKIAPCGSFLSGIPDTQRCLEIQPARTFPSRPFLEAVDYRHYGPSIRPAPVITRGMRSQDSFQPRPLACRFVAEIRRQPSRARSAQSLQFAPKTVFQS